MDNTTPVVILGSDGLWGLGILRTLGRLGVPIYVASSNPRATAFYSKYCTGKIPSEVCDCSERSVSLLLGVGRRIGRESVLVPASDQSVIFVADHADALSEWFTFPHQTSELVRSLCSKEEMYYLAKKHKVPTPEAVFPESINDVHKFLETASLPVMLKTIHSRAMASGLATKMIVYSEADLIRNYVAIQASDNPGVILQEFIPGADSATWLFEGYFDESSISLFDVTGTKIRQWRRHNGLTSLGTCLRNKTVETMTRDLMKALGYRGIVDIGYRYDSRDGQFKLLDFNPRIGATFRLFVGKNGMDVARAFYLDITGQEVPQDYASDGRKWFIDDLDLASAALDWLDGELSLRNWLNSYRGAREAAYFALDDPRPFMEMCKDNLRQLPEGIGKMRRLAE